MRIKFPLSLLALCLFCVTAYAADVKRPLTVKSYAKQRYLEWTGSAPIVTADQAVFFADTASTGTPVDPYNFLFTNKLSIGSEQTYPAERYPEKACVALTVAGDADATTSDVYLMEGATASATLVKVGATAATHTSTASVTVSEIVAVPHIPNLFWKLVVDPTTATDSIEITGVRIYPCDD